MKQFNFQRPDSDDAAKQNWSILTNNMKGDLFDPFYGTTAVAAGFTNVSNTTKSYSYVIGPICFFTITLAMLPGLGSWSNGSALILPYSQALNRGASDNNYLQTAVSFPSVNYNGNCTDWWVLNNAYPSGPPRLLSVYGQGAGTVDNHVTIAGWYFRE